MYLKRGQIWILIVNVILLGFFTWKFVERENYEFLMYIGVIIFFLLVILFTNKKVKYPNYILWLLTLWSFFHMAGGGLYYNGKIWYSQILINLVGEPYYIFRYDQFVHIFGFMVATFLIYHFLSFIKSRNYNGKVMISIVAVMAGLGVGALNEIIEFIATVIMPQTGVGGFINTSLDLVSDLVGALIAMIVVLIKGE